MIRLTFAIGGNIRRVYIDKRVISMLTAETGWVPVKMDLDKLESSNSLQKKIQSKLGEDDLKLLKEIALLETEEDMAKDIINDFQSTGWRCIRRE